MSPLPRRRFLQSLGSGLIALPLFPWQCGTKKADTTALFPKRLVVVFTPGGTPRLDRLFAQGTDGFRLGSTLQPLKAHQDKLLFLEGITMATTTRGPGDGHSKGIGQLLTGTPLLEGKLFEVFFGGSYSGWAGGISVDRAAAAHFKGSTPFPSLHLGVHSHPDPRFEVIHALSYAGPNKPIASEDNPQRVFEALFGLTPELIQQRMSVLDLVKADLKDAQAGLGYDAKQRFAEHLNSVEELERSMRQRPTQTSNCAPPESAPQNTASFDALGAQQMDLLVHALRCDLTRVATLQWSFASGTHVFSDLGISQGHHHITHQGRSEATRRALRSSQNNAKSVQSAMAQLQKIERWYAQKFADLLTRMDAVKEGDGTLLDNSLVLWCNELDEPWSHQHNNMPFVLAGGCQGALKTGRLLRYSAQSHNDLLSAILNLMDIPVESFGDPDFCVAPLTGLST